MTGFDAREREFEARFALEEELRFKVRARRNRLAGLWAAPLLGLTEPAAEDYARQLTDLLVQPKGDELLFDRLQRDLAAAGKPISREQLRAELEWREKEARRQIESGC
jgi:hypothetical protein